MFLLVIWIACAFICASIASSKHRSGLGWFFLGLIFGIFAVLVIAAVGDGRPQTIIVQQAMVAHAPPTAPQEPVDTSRWSKKDRDAYEAKFAPARAIRQIEGTVRAAATAAEPRDPRELEPAIAALKMLAAAGHDGDVDGRSMDAIITYLEAESGGIEYTRRQADRVAAWVSSVAAGDEAMRSATKVLKATVGQPERFLDAMTMIAGTAPTDLQNRWISALRRVVDV